MITLFSAPKPFTDERIARIQRNAVHSWLALGEEVEVLLLGDEPGLDQAAEELGVPVIPVKSRAPSGAPLIDELFRLARERASNPLLTYLNADIILLDDFRSTVELVSSKFDKFLVVGNRWDLVVNAPLVFEERWIERMRMRLYEEGQEHPPMGSDYFIYRKGQFTDMPAFALGRAGWDNWMMYKARRSGWPLIDASGAITAVHQEHDYAHLPGGEPHYRHPESARNIELAGGLETMFRLRDANWVLTREGVRKKELNEFEWPRKLEADLIAVFGAGYAARVTRMLFHPRHALAYLMQRLSGADRDHPAGSRGSEEQE